MTRNHRYVAGYPTGKAAVQEQEAMAMDFYGADPENKKKEVLNVLWRGPFEGYR